MEQKLVPGKVSKLVIDSWAGIGSEDVSLVADPVRLQPILSIREQTPEDTEPREIDEMNFILLSITIRY